MSEQRKHVLDLIGEHPDPLMTLQQFMLKRGGRSLPLGGTGQDWIGTRPDHHLLVVGSPRSGKTSSLLANAVTAHPGPVVSASTQADVFEATSLVRSLGCSPATELWVYDPTGREQIPAGARELRWSPITAAATYDEARAVARAMIAASPNDHRDVKEGGFWRERAGALLAVLLHAGCLAELSMGEVMMLWILQQDVENVAEILERHDSLLARAELVGIMQSHHEMLTSIWQSVASSVAAYASPAALAVCDRPNFDPDAFVRSYPASQEFADGLVPNLQGTLRAASTVYILSQGDDQKIAAPLVVGLLTAIKRAAYAHHRRRQHAGRGTGVPVLFALDELANIAPIDTLPEMLSEGGSRGILVLGCIQDLSQARDRWGRRAEGFLTLFGDAVILPGITDPQTLSMLSDLAGEYDRIVRSFNYQEGLTRPPIPLLAGLNGIQRNTGWGYQDSIQRERVLPPDQIYRGPDRTYGHAYALQGSGPYPLYLTPYFSTSPWPQLIVRCTEHAAARSLHAGRWWNWEPPHQPHRYLPAPRLATTTLAALGGPALAERWITALVNRKEQ